MMSQLELRFRSNALFHLERADTPASGILIWNMERPDQGVFLESLRRAVRRLFINHLPQCGSRKASPFILK